MADPGAPGRRGRVRLVEWWIGDRPRFERIESWERKHLWCEPRSHCRTGHNGFAWLTRISSGVGRAGRTSVLGAGRWVLLHPALAALGHDRRLNSLISGGPGNGQRRGSVTTFEG